MNSIKQLNYEYLSPNKTIETLTLSNGKSEKTLFIYNYQGVSFRVFLSQNKLKGFWSGTECEDKHFETEKELDNFLAQVKL